MADVRDELSPQFVLHPYPAQSHHPTDTLKNVPRSFFGRSFQRFSMWVTTVGDGDFQCGTGRPNLAYEAWPLVLLGAQSARQRLSAHITSLVVIAKLRPTIPITVRFIETGSNSGAGRSTSIPQSAPPQTRVLLRRR